MKTEVLYCATEVAANLVREICIKLDRKQELEGKVSLIKDDRTSTVFHYRTKEYSWIIKRYNRKNLWHGFRRNFQKSRAVNNFEVGRIFEDLGILVPATVAVLEERQVFLKGRSWYVSQYIEGQTLLSYLFENPETSNFDVILGLVARLFGIIKQNALSHGDMKASNLILANQDDDISIFVIDLDAAQYGLGPRRHARAYSKDIQRFLKNWQRMPVIHDSFKQRLQVI